MTPQLSIKDHLYSAEATSWDLCPEKCLLEHTFFFGPWPLPPLSGGIFHVHFFFLSQSCVGDWHGAKGAGSPVCVCGSCVALFPPLLVSFPPFPLMKFSKKMLFFVLYWIHWVQVTIFYYCFILPLSSPWSRITVCRVQPEFTILFCQNGPFPGESLYTAVSILMSPYLGCYSHSLLRMLIFFKRSHVYLFCIPTFP